MPHRIIDYLGKKGEAAGSEIFTGFGNGDVAQSYSVVLSLIDMEISGQIISRKEGGNIYFRLAEGMD